MHLQMNNIDDLGAAFISKGLEHNNTLTELRLDGNNIKNAGAQVIGNGLSSNSTLLNLNFSGNRITSDGGEAISESFSRRCIGDKIYELILIDESETGIKIGDWTYAEKEDVTKRKNVSVQMGWGKSMRQMPCRIQKIYSDGNCSVLFENGDTRIYPFDDIEISKNQEYGRIEEINFDGTYKINFISGEIRYSCPSRDTNGCRYKRGVVMENDGNKSTLVFEDQSKKVIRVNTSLDRLKINAEIPIKIFRDGQTEQLELEQKNYQDAETIIIAALIAENTHIKYLNISGSRQNCGIIGDAGASALAKALKVNQSLTDMRICSNLIKDIGAAAIGEAIKINSSLKRLYLYGNKIGNIGAVGIGEGLKVNVSLIELRLNRNLIADEGAKVMSEAFKVNKVLAILWLYDNKITDQGAISLANGLKSNRALQELYLGNNWIGATGSTLLRNVQKGHQYLQKLDME